MVPFGLASGTVYLDLKTVAMSGGSLLAGTRTSALHISSALKLAFDSAKGTDLHRKRLSSIVQGLVTGLASRVLGILVTLLSVPLTIGYLGPERYGIWVLLSSLLAWVRLADLGIGNGLTNAIANALASERPDLVRAHVSTAFALLSGIAVVLGIVAVLVWPWVDWSALFGINDHDARAEVGPAVAASVGIFLLAFPLSVIGTTYNAIQEGKLANYWSMAGNVASLLSIIVVTHTGGGLIWLVIAVSASSLLMNLASGVWLFAYRRPTIAPQLRSIQKASVRGLYQVGVPFFLIQIVALFVFQTDNFIVAHFLGAEDVPSYSLTYTLFGYTTIIQTILFSYVWVAYTDAIARRDFGWIRRTLMLNLAFSLASTLTTVVPMIFIARPFIELWTRGVVIPKLDLVLWMAAWSMINALCSPIACLLAAAAHMRAQIVYSAISAVINIVLSIYLVKIWGISGVIAGTVLSYMLFICIPASIDTLLLLRKLRNAM
jgi:O-antigen/teichoic acid export membrane protein